MKLKLWPVCMSPESHKPPSEVVVCTDGLGGRRLGIALGGFVLAKAVAIMLLAVGAVARELDDRFGMRVRWKGSSSSL